MIPTFADELSLLTGWRRALAAVGLGALAALALPPVHFVPVLLISFPGLVWLLDGQVTRKGAFGVAWWWGVGHFAAGLYWVAEAFLIYPERHAWMIPFAMAALGAGMGLFPAVAAVLARPRGWPTGWRRIVLFAAAWTLLEWVRGWFLTGFPWNLIGSVWAGWPETLQSVSLFGTYGLSLLTVLAASSVALLGDREHKPWTPMLIAWAPLVLVMAWGLWRLPAGPTPAVAGVHLRLVQANVEQSKKWQPGWREQYYVKQINMSRQVPAPGQPRPTAVIWPETSAYFSLDIDTVHRAEVATAAPRGGLLIAGSPRVRDPGTPQVKLWNSLFAVTDGSELVGRFDKHHLVPFGEYVPFKEWLPIPKLTVGSVDFTPGPGLATLHLPGLPPVSPLICYEAIFPGAVARDDDRPQWLLNLTNDAWFGTSAGPYQHFAAARLRAVEEGIPLVRVAGTGISAVVDPYGRTVASLGLGVAGVLDTILPQSISTYTIYARYGNWIVFSAIFVCFASGFLSRRRNASKLS